MRLSKKYPKIMLIVTGVAFIVSGIDCLENNLLFIAISSFVVGAINVAACLFVKKHPFVIKIFLLSINAAFAFLSSYFYFEAGRDKIQYGWAAVGLISLIFIVKTYENKARERDQLKDDQIKHSMMK